MIDDNDSLCGISIIFAISSRGELLVSPPSTYLIMIVNNNEQCKLKKGEYFMTEKDRLETEYNDLQAHRNKQL